MTNPDAAPAAPPSLRDIERLAATYAARRAALGDVVRDANAELAAVRARFRRRVAGRAAAANLARDNLLAALQASAALFARPRTRLLHGIRVGWRTRPAGVDIPDEQRTIAAIERQFADTTGYLRTKTTVLKSALRHLAPAVLKSLHCRPEPAVDAPTVQPADSEIDELAAALLEP